MGNVPSSVDQSKEDVDTIHGDNPQALNDTIQTDEPSLEASPQQVQCIIDDGEVSRSSGRDDLSSLSEYSIVSKIRRSRTIKDLKITTNIEDDDRVVIPSILDLPRIRLFTPEQKQESAFNQNNSIEHISIKGLATGPTSRSGIVPVWIRQSPRLVKQVLVFCVLILLGCVCLLIPAIMKNDLMGRTSTGSPPSNDTLWLDEISNRENANHTLSPEPVEDKAVTSIEDFTPTPQPTHHSGSPSITPTGLQNTPSPTIAPYTIQPRVTPSPTIAPYTIQPRITPSPTIAPYTIQATLYPTILPSLEPTKPHIPSGPWESESKPSWSLPNVRRR